MSQIEDRSRRGHMMCIREVAEFFGVSEKTVRRLIETVSSARTGSAVSGASHLRRLSASSLPAASGSAALSHKVFICPANFTSRENV